MQTLPHSFLRHLIPLHVRGAGPASHLLRHAFLHRTELIPYVLRAVEEVDLPLTPRLLFAEAFQQLLDGAWAQREVRALFDQAVIESRRVLYDTPIPASAGRHARSPCVNEHNQSDAGSSTTSRSVSEVYGCATDASKQGCNSDDTADQRNCSHAQHCHADPESDRDTHHRAIAASVEDDYRRRCAVHRCPLHRLLAYELCAACEYFASLLAITSTPALHACVAVRTRVMGDVCSDALLIAAAQAFVEDGGDPCLDGVNNCSSNQSSVVVCPNINRTKEEDACSRNKSNTRLAIHDAFIEECLLLERDVLGRCHRFGLRGGSRFLVHSIKLSELGRNWESCALLNKSVMQRCGNWTVNQRLIHNGRWCEMTLRCAEEDHRLLSSLPLREMVRVVEQNDLQSQQPQQRQQARAPPTSEGACESSTDTLAASALQSVLDEDDSCATKVDVGTHRGAQSDAFSELIGRVGDSHGSTRPALLNLTRSCGGTLLPGRGVQQQQQQQHTREQMLVSYDLPICLYRSHGKSAGKHGTTVRETGEQTEAHTAMFELAMPSAQRTFWQKWFVDR